MSKIVEIKSTQVTAGDVVRSKYFNYTHEVSDFRIAFYNAAGDIINTGSGSIIAEVEVLPGQFMSAGQGDQVISVADCGATATYDIPLFGRPALSGRVRIITDLDTVSSFIAQFYLT